MIPSRLALFLYFLLFLIMLNSLHGEIPRLKVDSVERAFAEHKKCFRQCLKGFQTGTLSEPERACIVGCLSKYKQSERYLSEKVHRLMTEVAAQSEEVKSLYNVNLDRAGSKKE